MVFSSLTFLFCFLPIVFVAYFLCKDIMGKNLILLIASLLFYAWGEPVYVILMILSILYNYYAGREIEETHRKSSLVLAIIVNILILGYFKYSGFLIDTINGIFGTTFRNRELALPIGISFYTFQAMSYLIDVYRKDSKSQKSILSFAVYITMFPQLIAGPIVRYQDIEDQLNGRIIKSGDFAVGVPIFIKGFFKKVVLANCVGALHSQILGMGVGNISAFTAWIGAIAYTLQIFNDFSGYSDMAIGLGKMFGFDFPMNFDRPYSSKSVTEFWRRWHISLGTWFREYVYIPLGGNRRGKARHIINMLIVWALTGLWHGAAWNFVAWGLYYGILLILDKYVFVKFQKKIPEKVNVLITFIIVIIGWVFFFSNSMGEAGSYLGAMFGGNKMLFDRTGWFLFVTNIIMLFLAWIPSVVTINLNMSSGKNDKYKIQRTIKWIFCVLAFAIGIAFLVSESYNPFLYFRF